MNVRSQRILVIVALIASAWCAGRLMSADPPQPQTRGSDLTKVSRQIAELSLKLAENEQQVLVSANERLPNTFPRAVIEQAQALVAAAKQRVELEMKDDNANALASYVALATAEQKAADVQYRSAIAANKLAQDAVPPLEVERLRLTADLAKLRLDRARQAKDVSQATLVEWQLDALREQVQQIAQQVKLYRGNE